jgi:hypothetical protein
MQDDEHLFAFIDAQIRGACAQKARQEHPWAGDVLVYSLVFLAK